VPAISLATMIKATAMKVCRSDPRKKKGAGKHERPGMKAKAALPPAQVNLQLPATDRPLIYPLHGFWFTINGLIACSLLAMPLIQVVVRASTKLVPFAVSSGGGNCRT